MNFFYLCRRIILEVLFPMYALHFENTAIQKTHVMVNNGAITTLRVTDCMNHMRRTLGEKVWRTEI